MRLFRISIAVAAVLALAAGVASATELRSSNLSKGEIEKAPSIGVENTQGLLDCSGAIEVTPTVGIQTFSGTNVGAPNNVSLYGCSPWDESGGEVVYHVNFPDDVIWAVGFTSIPWWCDLDIAVLDQCDEDLGCVAVVDHWGYVASPWAGDFYFVVDGNNGAECAYDLTFNIREYTPPPAMCDLVLDVEGSYFTGSTCDGYDLVYDFDCADYPEGGLEHYYEIFMPAGSSFTADVVSTADGALWVLDGCVEPYTCLGYADDTLSNQLETVSYTNTSGMDTSVILVIDSFRGLTCGDYTLTFSSTSGAIATEVENFGTVKAMFR